MTQTFKKWCEASFLKSDDFEVYSLLCGEDTRLQVTTRIAWNQI